MTRRSLGVAVALYAFALLARLWASSRIVFPIPEDAAYYMAVARNLVEGRGLVVDAIWTYATPPLVFPRPAFELWQPLASLLAAAPMVLVGPSFAAAQLASAVVGALVAPLGWAIARDAAAELGLPSSRARVVAVGSGLLAALLGLLVLQGATPDSAAPFTTLALLACWLMPRALRPGTAGDRWRVALGLVLGLAYLARQEAIYLGIAYVATAWMDRRRSAGPAGDRAAPRAAPPSLARALLLPAATALLVVAPWLWRQAVTFERPTIWQALENAWLLRNEEIFAWAERPSLASHLAAGPARWVELRAEGFAHNLVAVLAVPGMPAGPLGIATLALRPRLLALPALRPLAIASALIFAVATLVFPVASRWGTFLHAAGPVLVLLAILAAIGLDELVARTRRIRAWPRENAWLAPFALLALAVPTAGLETTLLAAQAEATATRYAAIGRAATGWDVPRGGPVIGNHPVWLSEALGVGALALPDEPAASLLELAARFGARLVVVDGPAGARYPAGLAPGSGDPDAACFRELGGAPPEVRVFLIVCSGPASTGRGP